MAKKQQIKDFSGNTLCELLGLMSRINGLINDYIHVSDNLPDSLTKEIKSFETKLNKEMDKREDEF